MTIHDQQLLDDAERHVYAVGEHPDDWIAIGSDWERDEYTAEPLDDWSTTDLEGRPYQ